MDDVAISALLAAWGYGPCGGARMAASGAVNTTWLIATRRGDVVLRCYASPDRGHVEREHTVIAFAAARGAPAVAPLPLPDGSTFLQHDSRWYALFPHAPGQQLPREQIGPTEAAAMGAALARLHRALASFPHQHATRRATVAETTETHRHIAALEATITALRQRGPDEHAALAALAGRRAYLAEHVAPTVPFGALPEQLIHGDFQDANLFFANGAVSAMIDWDQTYLAPRGWEVLRTLHFVWDFAPWCSVPFLRAYNDVWPLLGDELECTAAWYSWLRAHHLWVYEAAYHQGNHRARRFFERGGFVPLEEAWATLRVALEGTA